MKQMKKLFSKREKIFSFRFENYPFFLLMIYNRYPLILRSFLKHSVQLEDRNEESLEVYKKKKKE